MNRHRITRTLILCLVVVAAVAFAWNDSKLYTRPIGRITSCTTSSVEDKRENDPAYQQEITLELQNTDRVGETVQAVNNYTKAQFKTTAYHEGQYVFLALGDEATDSRVRSDASAASKDQAANSESNDRAASAASNAQAANSELNEAADATILYPKLDMVWALLLSIFAGLLLMVAGRRSILIFASLVMNLVVFYLGMKALATEHHIALLTILLTIIFVAGTMLILNGLSRISFGSVISSLLTILIVTLVYLTLLRFTAPPSFEFQDYSLGNESLKAFFLVSLVFGILGAVMDVAITINASVSEITSTADQLTIRSMIASLQEISNDIMGTMINVMFFTFFCGELPIIVLKLCNDYSLLTLTKYGTQLELIRFLIGSLGIVLAIPVSGLVACFFHRTKIRWSGPGNSGTSGAYGSSSEYGPADATDDATTKGGAV